MEPCAAIENKVLVKAVLPSRMTVDRSDDRMKHGELRAPALLIISCRHSWALRRMTRYYSMGEAQRQPGVASINAKCIHRHCLKEKESAAAGQEHHWPILRVMGTASGVNSGFRCRAGAARLPLSRLHRGFYGTPTLPRHSQWS